MDAWQVRRLEVVLLAAFFVAAAMLMKTDYAYALDPGDMLPYFEQTLSPYGRWTTREPYGRVWIPSERGDWRPYTHGRWVYTDEYGWVWRPDEEWGEVAYHYGRWAFDRGTWIWVPDQVWGPAWVDWYETNNYIGWAPLGPNEDWHWYDEWRPSHRDDAPSRYTFVPLSNFADPQVYRYAVPVQKNAELIPRAQRVTEYRTERDHVVNKGPQRQEIERRSGKTVAAATYEPHSIRGQKLPRPIAKPRDQNVQRAQAPAQTPRREDRARQAARPEAGRSEAARPKEERPARPEAKRPEVQRQQQQEKAQPRAAQPQSQSTDRAKDTQRRREQAAREPGRPQREPQRPQAKEPKPQRSEAAQGKPHGKTEERRKDGGQEAQDGGPQGRRAGAPQHPRQ